MRTGAASTKRRDPSLLTRLTSRLTTSPAPSAANAEEFLARLKARSPHPVVLVVGGAVVGSGAAALYEDPSVRIVGTDIYRSELTAVVADGHQLPFADGSFDGVWVQAVLEHVLEPHRVVEEIHRILGDGGYVIRRDALHATGARGRVRLHAVYSNGPPVAVSRLRGDLVWRDSWAGNRPALVDPVSRRIALPKLPNRKRRGGTVLLAAVPSIASPTRSS